MPCNRLQNEKSPYLLQHAQNPVDWYPWGEDAFAKARREDKPVFLSIGYSTCHWCHVMAHESFEDNKVAGLLNETFVNIKVDREERPDIDAVYMKACQLMTQSGGWPLTIMMTPDKKPFFAATYIPRETRYGRVGLLEMIPEVKLIWQTKRGEVLSAAAEITGILQRPSAGGDKDVGEEVLHRAYQSLSASFDREYGGFGHAPKFPSPHNLSFLLRYWKRTGEAEALHLVENTVRNMLRGGIWDHVGFGFHRYSTDERWVVPHFEKMLYDQAMMALAAVELFQATGKEEYKTLAREIFDYVLRDLTDGQGGFYCAEDADSEGVEGKFYLWTEAEVRGVLTKDEAELFLSLYRDEGDLTLQGMQELPSGHFIAHLRPLPESDGEEAAERSGMPEDVRKKLFTAREKRIRPHRDDKILTDWNGLMIAALARGAQVFEEPVYLKAAVRAAEFIFRFLRSENGRLLHRFRDGEGAIAANVDDYSFMICALLELYEATFEMEYLFKALEFQSHLFAYFRDDWKGGYFLTASDAEALLTRPKELYDGAIPSGNSMAFMNTLRLSRMTGDAELDERAHEIYRAFRSPADAAPTNFTQFLCGLDFAIGPASEVIIAGDERSPDTQTMLRALRRSFVPNKIVIFRPEGQTQPQIETIAPYVQAHTALDGRTTAYVCTNFACQAPTHDPGKMMELLTGK
ncbi:MAG: thioredoxin domain-containing protein [Deltaproteobacteria bacterium]|nr:thioredoxin domain-containing protein [Deltaproteobacteria bacterium]